MRLCYFAILLRDYLGSMGSKLMFLKKVNLPLKDYLEIQQICLLFLVNIQPAFLNLKHKKCLTLKRKSGVRSSQCSIHLLVRCLQQRIYSRFFASTPFLYVCVNKVLDLTVNLKDK